MSLRKPFIIVGQRAVPTCRRTDCCPSENPEHWVSTQLTREASCALKLFPEMAAMLKDLQIAAIYYDEREGSPCTLRDLQRLLKKINRLNNPAKPHKN